MHLKIWLDDERPAPFGWIPTRWPSEAILFLQSFNVSEISLDHDLGDDERGTGYDVLLWLEEQVFTNPTYKLPKIKIHTANPSASKRMRQALSAIERRYNVRTQTEGNG